MNSAIGRVTSILSIPYGYTVSVWSAGALTVTRAGTPSFLDIMLFVLGTVADVLRYLASRSGQRRYTSPIQIVARRLPMLIVLPRPPGDRIALLDRVHRIRAVRPSRAG